jgi:NTE family protein
MTILPVPADAQPALVRDLIVFEGLFGNSNGHVDQPVEVPPVRPQAARPSIGLALGGGAARGFAHIGVLRVLLKHGIVPDVIVGTSIGAVVGACYAAGKLDELADWATSLTTRSVLGYLDVSLSGSGLIGGDRLAKRLEESLDGMKFEDLPIKFAAIATEIGTGHEIWLTRGRLLEALRASYALPGIFAPVRLGGKWLVDGALVNPLPISVARAFGARLVIGVNLNADRFGHGTTISSFGSDESDDLLYASPKEPRHGFGRMFDPERRMKRQMLGNAGRPGVSTVMVEAFNVMQDRITRARMAGDPPDVLISPRVGQIGWFDFHRAATTVQHGTEAAERAMESISEAVAALA